MRFRDREHAAQLLLERLRADYEDRNPLVIGIPRGAIPMAKIIADGLGGELDVMLVHKLSHPEQPELAVGAIDEATANRIAALQELTGTMSPRRSVCRSCPRCRA